MPNKTAQIIVRKLESGVMPNEPKRWFLGARYTGGQGGTVRRNYATQAKAQAEGRRLKAKLEQSGYTVQAKGL